MGISDELERLQSLRDRGALSEDEYVRAKAQVLQGAQGSSSGPGYTSFLHRLARSRTDRMIGGVCGGLGKQTSLPAWTWRLLFCLISLYFGAGLLLYLLLWIFLPLEPA
jgi:phage shock protein C